jgi:membrane fusion protein (multidrug efflux system)
MNTPDSASNLAADSDAPPAHRRKTMLLRLGMVIGLVAATWGLWYLLFERGMVSTDNAYVAADSAVITPRIAAAVAEVRVTDTQTVKAGDVLVRLDDADARVELASAEAALRQARQRFLQAQANGRSLDARVIGAAADISQARARLAASEAELRRAEDALARRQGLVGSGAVAGEELAQAKAAAATARANYNSALGAVNAAEAGRAAASGSAQANAVITGVGNIEADPDVVAARTRVEAVRLTLERTIIRAPIAGVVSQRQVQAGQQVAPGTPLMRIVPLAQVYVDANFRETQLRDVRIGQSARLTSDLYGSSIEFTGRVVGVGAASGAATALIPAQNATGNWVKVVQRIPVRIALDPAELKKHPLPIGASMEAEIDTRD